MIACKTLLRDRRGAAAVEFALLGPVVIMMMLGVLQLGMAMWTYNGMRSVASDVARYAVVNYQAANKLNNTQIQSYGRLAAINSPYGMAENNLTLTVTTATTQRVTGATELTLSINYNMPTMANIIGMGDIPMSYSRPIFVLP